MTLANTRDLVNQAIVGQRAVLAFNVITLENAEGIVAGVERADAQAILQVSENAIKFHGGQFSPILSACAHIAAASSSRIAIHLDHFQDAALTIRAIELAAELGVSSIMIDAAHLDHGLNTRSTRDLAKRAHDQGLWVEAELGEIGGKDGAHAPGVRTDPVTARQFVADTSVDGLAVAVGSSHAMTSTGANLDLELIGKLAEHVPVPLVLHGSSGVADAMIAAAIAAGIRKVNVGTALNVANTREIRRFLHANPEVTDPRKYLAEGREAIAGTVARFCAVADLRGMGPITALTARSPDEPSCM
jgi:fructose-bisphosphate aldolase class II